MCRKLSEVHKYRKRVINNSFQSLLTFLFLLLLRSVILNPSLFHINWLRKNCKQSFFSFQNNFISIEESFWSVLKWIIGFFFIFQIGSCQPGSCCSTIEYDEFTRRINMVVKFTTEGCYHATISLCGVQLHNGDFDIIVLSSTYFSRL